VSNKNTNVDEESCFNKPYETAHASNCTVLLATRALSTHTHIQYTHTIHTVQQYPAYNLTWEFARTTARTAPQFRVRLA